MSKKVAPAAAKTCQDCWSAPPSSYRITIFECIGSRAFSLCANARTHALAPTDFALPCFVLFFVLAARGKPSTWFPRERLVEKYCFDLYRISLSNISEFGLLLKYLNFRDSKK